MPLRKSPAIERVFADAKERMPAIHQLIPVEHDRKLIEVIPNAKDLWLDGGGHVFPVPDMEINNIISHLVL